MPEITWSPELLGVIASGILSLLFAYVPGLSDWFEPKTPKVKAGLMAILTILIAVAVFALFCGGFIAVIGLVCGKSGLTQVLWTIVLALVANQTTYLMFVRPYGK